MKRRLIWTLWSAVLVTVAAIGISATTASATFDWQQRVDASVLQAAAGGETEFFVYLKERGTVTFEDVGLFAGS